MTDQMNLLITDRETGEKYTDSQSNLREIWEDHYRVIDKGEEEPDIYIPEEYQADGFGLVFQDGTVEIYGWTSDGTACEPMPLNPERFSISIPGQISEEKVREVLKKEWNNEWLRKCWSLGDEWASGAQQAIEGIAAQFGITPEDLTLNTTKK